MGKRGILFTFCIGAAVTFLSFNSRVPVQEPWKAPSWADTLKNPFQVRWGANVMSPSKILETKELYNTYCATCHGKTGSGDGALGADFKIKPADFHSNTIRAQRDGAIFWKLTQGRGNMPPFKETLPEEKRWQLVAYIRQLASMDNGEPGVLKFEKSRLTDFKAKPGTVSEYFPVPAKISNLIHSERQEFMVDTVVSGLQRGWSMAFLPDGSMLVAERSGRLLRVKKDERQGTPVSGDVPKELRDVKLHPDFKKNNLIYISYYINPVKPDGGYTVLMRARLDGNKLVDKKELYRAGPFNQSAFFFGSKIAFDRAGHLYFTVGISGDRKNAQDLSRHEGKTMRLNEDGSIPKDNPFVDKPGALPEIYSYGHRMHEGLLYDIGSAKILSTEFGEFGGDELNVINRGANYGWPEVTYSREYTGGPISPDSLRKDVEAPVHHWMFAPSDLEAVYNSPYSAWNGNIFIGGLLRKSLLRVVLKNGIFIDDEVLLENIGRIRDVKQGPDKLLYVMTEDSGIIARLIPVQKK